MNCTDIRVLLSNQPHLTNEEVTAVRDHVATCNACSRARLLEQQTSALLDLLEPSTARLSPARVADIEAKLNGSSPWRLPLMANLATVVALAALLFWGVQAVRTDRSGLEIADRSSTTPTSLTAASPPATSTPLLTFTPQPSEAPTATAGPGTPTAAVATPTAIIATPAFNARPTQARPTNVVPIAPPSAVPAPPTSVPDVPATATPWVAPTATQGDAATPDLASATPPPTEAPAATAPPGRTRTPVPTATATPEPTSTPEETATPGTNPYPYPTPEAPTDTPEPTAEGTLEPPTATATPADSTATPIVDPPTAEPTVAPDA